MSPRGTVWDGEVEVEVLGVRELGWSVWVVQGPDWGSD